MPTEAKGLNAHLTFHHLGLAVRRPREAELFLVAMGYSIGEAVYDPGQNVNLKMCPHSTEPDVEIIWPGETEGPLSGLIQRGPEGIIYHVCYQTNDLEAGLEALRQAGLKVACVSPPTPAPLFGGREVSFYKVLGIGLVEILDLRLK